MFSSAAVRSHRGRPAYWSRPHRWPPSEPLQQPRVVPRVVASAHKATTASTLGLTVNRALAVVRRACQRSLKVDPLALLES